MWCQILFNSNKTVTLPTLWYTHAPIHGKVICCRIALNLFKVEKDSVVEVYTLGCSSPWWFEPPNPAVLFRSTYSGRGYFYWHRRTELVRKHKTLHASVTYSYTGGLPPRWPHLSQIAWLSKNIFIFPMIKRRCPATRDSHIQRIVKKKIWTRLDPLSIPSQREKCQNI